MSRAALAALGLTIATACWAQQPVFPPGGGIGLVPPAEFVASRAFSGFERARDGASFVLMEFPPEACAGTVQALTPERLATQGISAETTRQLRIGGRDATLLVGSQRQPDRVFAKWILLFCNDAVTGMASAQVPGYPPAPADATAIEAALASVAVRSLTLEERRAALPFAFTDVPGQLVLRDVVGGNAATFTRPDAPRAPGTPLLVIGFTRGPVIPPEQVEPVAERILSVGPQFTGLQIVGRSRVRVGKDAEAVRLEARATDRARGTPMRLVQWFVPIPDGGHLRVVASAPEADYPAFAANFDAVARSVSLR